MTTTLSKGDPVRCVGTKPGAKRQVGWTGEVTDITPDSTGYSDGSATVQWDNNEATWQPISDLEKLPTEECAGCHEQKRLEAFDGDYLCYDCRAGTSL